MFMEGRDFKEFRRDLDDAVNTVSATAAAVVTAVVGTILSRFAGTWCIGAGNGFQFPTAVTIVLINIKDQLNFLLGLFWSCAKTVGPALLTFEGGYKGARVIAGIWLQNNISV
jgi:hypothetical protein